MHSLFLCSRLFFLFIVTNVSPYFLLALKCLPYPVVSGVFRTQSVQVVVVRFTVVSLYILFRSPRAIVVLVVASSSLYSFSAVLLYGNMLALRFVIVLYGSYSIDVSNSTSMLIPIYKDLSNWSRQCLLCICYSHLSLLSLTLLFGSFLPLSSASESRILTNCSLP